VRFPVRDARDVFSPADRSSFVGRDAVPRRAHDPGRAARTTKSPQVFLSQSSGWPPRGASPRRLSGASPRRLSCV
jgi:hypothetical protein